ncbi:MAG TPA: hypothetical protein ENI89_09655 [Desulfobulbus sp.]|nr:hypothetical protein [Desulfobulbus sp.]
MKAITTAKTETRTDVGYEATRFTLHAGIAMATLVGIWGFACMIGGLANCGAAELLRGFLAAVTGA